MENPNSQSALAQVARVAHNGMIANTVVFMGALAGTFGSMRNNASGTLSLIPLVFVGAAVFSFASNYRKFNQAMNQLAGAPSTKQPPQSSNFSPQG